MLELRKNQFYVKTMLNFFSPELYDIELISSSIFIEMKEGLSYCFVSINTVLHHTKYL